MNLINSSPRCSDATHACPAAGPHQVSYPAFYRSVDCPQLREHGTDDGMDIQGGSDIHVSGRILIIYSLDQPHYITAKSLPMGLEGNLI